MIALTVACLRALTSRAVFGAPPQHASENSGIKLIISFLYRAIKRTDSGNNEVEFTDTIPLEFNKKRSALQVLALKTAAHLNWDLEIFEQKLPLHMQDALMSALLNETMEEHKSPTSHATLDTGPLLPYQLFSVSLYHRYALRALLKSKLPAKPVRVSNVPIPGQQDPTHESREVQEGIYGMLERSAETSVRILEQLLGAGQVSVPNLATFTVHTHQSTSVAQSWERCKTMPDEEFKCQIHYDLGSYHFLQERYEDAFSHFSEAVKLFSELGSNPEYCNVNEAKLQGYYNSCASMCGRKTPVEQRSLYDRFNFALKNRYQGILDVLSEDNLHFEIPSYLRLNLELDLLTCTESTNGQLPEMLGLQVSTMNTIRCVLEGEVWNSSYPRLLVQAGHQGVNFLIQALAAKAVMYNGQQKQQVRRFIMSLCVQEGVGAIVTPALQSSPPIGTIFSQEELYQLCPDLRNTQATPPMDAVKKDLNESSDLIWDLIHSYDPSVLKSALNRYHDLKPQGPQPKTPVTDLNLKWELPIPVHNTLMKLGPPIVVNQSFIFLAKAFELTQAKSFMAALGLMDEVLELTQKLQGRDVPRFIKLVVWMRLQVRIQHALHLIPDIDEATVMDLSSEAKQCLAAHSVSGREGIAPWTSVNNWCVLLLLNSGEWESLLVGNLVPPHLPVMAIINPLAATAQSLREKNTNKKVWYDLWGIVVNILGSSIQHKRSSSGQTTTMERHQEDLTFSSNSFLKHIPGQRPFACPIVFITLIGFNILSQNPNDSFSVTHHSKFRFLVSNAIPLKKSIENSTWLLRYLTKIWPINNTITSKCWHLATKDL
ncbi:unnamed protein product, partial [Meganyctiphanes norvegica]